MKAFAILLAMAFGASLSAQTLQTPSHSGGVISDGASSIACDDCQFTNTTRLYGVTWWGQTNKAAGPPLFSVAILSEFLGRPGPVELYLRVVPAMSTTGADFSSGQPEVRYEVYFPTSFVAQANGRYWIEINGGGRNWAWEGAASGGPSAMQRDLGNVGNPWVQGSANLAFSLQLTPSPAVLALQRDWKLQLYGSVAGSYSVEWADSLTATQWNLLTNIALSSSPHSIALAATNEARRFYRAISVP